MLRGIIHYGLHFIAPYFIAYLWGRSRQVKAYLILLATMLVDLDHLLVRPIFDPNRCSVGFHLLHAYPMIALYALLCILPLRRLGLPWWVRVVGVGLLFHMVTDWQDFYLWR